MRHGKARVPDTAEFSRLTAIVAAKRYPERNAAIVAMSYGLGMRVGEITSLEVGDVVDAKGKVRGEFTIKRENSKNGKPRTIYVTNKKVIAAIKTYIDALLATGDVSTDRPLFQSQYGGAFRPKAMGALFARLYAAAGLEGCKSHSGRRTFITTLDRNGVSLKNIATLVGHSSVKQTADYIETSPEVLKGVAGKVDLV